MEINECKTVEDVENLRCKDCSNTGHWGWCDAPHIKCEYKDKIKSILGISKCKYTIENHINGICLNGGK
jgi:predicted transport protein